MYVVNTGASDDSESILICKYCRCTEENCRCNQAYGEWKSKKTRWLNKAKRMIFGDPKIEIQNEREAQIQAETMTFARQKSLEDYELK